jgi:hypothetical protein
MHPRRQPKIAVLPKDPPSERLLLYAKITAGSVVETRSRGGDFGEKSNPFSRIVSFTTSKEFHAPDVTCPFTGASASAIRSGWVLDTRPAIQPRPY